MKVSIITTSLLKPDGSEYLLGGNERYLLDVVEVYKKLNFTEINIFQPSSKSFSHKDSDMGINIKGIKFERMNVNSYIKLNKIFNSLTKNEIKHFQSFTLAFPYVKGNSLGICHGVSWDKPVRNEWGESYKWSDLVKRNFKNKVLLSRYYKAAKKLDNLIANDTNFINFMRVSWPALAHKATYIPNYVDLEYYNKTSNTLIQNDKEELTVLFPRRLSKERGYFMAFDVAKSIVAKYPHVKFIFTGKKPNERHQNIIFKEALFDDINQLYEISDIVIIPTISSEGTSLSCLEAMASGIPVVSTNVGGLTDLVINEYNGLLISPESKQLFSAIEKLILNKNMRSEMGKNGRLMAKKFSKKKWEERWEEIIEGMIRKNDK